MSHGRLRLRFVVAIRVLFAPVTGGQYVSWWRALVSLASAGFGTDPLVYQRGRWLNCSSDAPDTACQGIIATPVWSHLSLVRTMVKSFRLRTRKTNA
jgi:hypothetical protein